MSRLVTDHLPLLAGAPNGVKKLRELILELAVRGKLVAQDSGDEPAIELLKRITTEKTRLAGDKKAKTRVSDAPNLMDLPNGWISATLAEVAFINPRNKVDDALEVSFVPMALIGTSFKGAHSQESRAWHEVKQGFTHFAEGDVGIAKITPCFENSKACVFSGLKNNFGAGTTELHIVRPIAGLLNARYILAYIKSPQFLLIGETRMTGTAGQKRLPKDFVENNPFPLPPLAEQARIVAKVDELMALCDRLETRQSDAQAAHARLVDELLGSLLQARDAEDFAECWGRVKGSFDVIFSSEESFDALRKAILHVAAEGRLVTTTSPAQFIPIEKLLVGDTLNGCSRKPFDEPIGTPILRISAATGSDDFFVDEIDHRWVELSETEKGKFNLQPNDLLACRFNGNLHYVGSFALYRGSKKVDPIFPDKLIRFRINPEIARPHYIRYVINATPARKQIESFCATTVGNIGISATNLKTVQVRVPEIEEQERIIAKLDEILALCDGLKARIRQARQMQERLAGTLVERAVL